MRFSLTTLMLAFLVLLVACSGGGPSETQMERLIDAKEGDANIRAVEFLKINSLEDNEYQAYTNVQFGGNDAYVSYVFGKVGGAWKIVDTGVGPPPNMEKPPK